MRYVENGKTHVSVIVPGQPYSKARPRVTSKGTYTPAKQKANAEELAWAFKIAMGGPPLRTSVGVHVVFYRRGLQRADLDNLIKQVLDAANKVCFEDDSQVVAIVARLERDDEQPRTELLLREHETSMQRGDGVLSTATCKRCGEDFQWRSYPSAKRVPSFCSQACRSRAEATCETCGETFVKNSPAQRFCTKTCAARSASRREAAATARRAAARPKNHCRSCGTELARQTSVQCRACWNASPKKKTTRAQILAQEARPNG